MPENALLKPTVSDRVRYRDTATDTDIPALVHAIGDPLAGVVDLVLLREIGSAVLPELASAVSHGTGRGQWRRIDE